MKAMRSAAVLGLLVALVGPTYAGNVGKASGVVTDASGQPVAGAKIVFKHAKQGFSREIETNESGKYMLSTLPYGPIEVTITAPGMAPTTESFDFVPQMSPLTRDFKVGQAGSSAPPQVIEGLTRELAAALDDANEAKTAGDYAKAATIYEDARKSTGDHPLLLMGLVECYVKSQQNDKAEAVLAIAVKLNPAPAGAHFYLGNMLAGKGKKAEAYAEFEAETKLSPENDRAFYNLGAMAVDLGKKEEGLAALKKANEINPANAEAAALLSSLLSESGDTAGATAVASSGGDTTSLLNVGIKLYGEHKDKEALDTLQKVVASDPKSAKAHKLIGLIHVRLGDLEAAKASLRKAKEIDPKDSETNQMLAELGG